MTPFIIPPPAPRGRTMLKVVGILLIVFCGMGFIPQLINTIAFPFMTSGDYIEDPNSILIIVSMVLFYLPIDLGLAAGILGVVATIRPQIGKLCLRFGVVLMIVPFLPVIASFYIWDLMASFILFVLCIPAIILSLLYTIGAYRYHKHYQEYLQTLQKEQTSEG